LPLLNLIGRLFLGMKIYSQESHCQEYYSHEHVCLTIVISEKLKNISNKEMWKNEVGIGSYYSDKFYFHGNPIYSPFSMGIRSKTIMGILHSWESTTHGSVFTKLVPNMRM